MGELVKNNFHQIYQGKKILVTGHTGFKGFWISRMLEELGAEVVGLSDGYRDTSLYALSKRPQTIQEAFIDIRNRDLIVAFFQTHQCDAIFHLAAQPLVFDSYRDPLTTFETNILGTANIIHASYKNFNLKFILVVTTDKVYENDDKGTPFAEDSKLGGHDPYSASKAAAEIVTSSLRSINGNMGPQLITARAGNVIGGGDDSSNRLIPDLVRSLTDNQPIIIRNPDSTRPWQHVLDPLAGYLKIGELCFRGTKVSNSYNLGPGLADSLSVAEICKAFENAWGRRLSIRESKSDTSSPREAILLSLDSHLAERELKWSNKLSTEEAIKWTVEWEKNVREVKRSPMNETIGQVRKFLNTH